MANLSDTKLVSGRTPVIGYSYSKAPASGELNNVLPPESFEGSWVYYENQMQFSTGTEWKSTDPPVIRTPSAAAPNPNILLTKRQLILTGYSTTVAGLRLLSARFQISLTREFVNPVTFSVEAAVTLPVNFVKDQYYTILTLGTTNWTAVGVTGSAAVGTVFKATGPGTGTGNATLNVNTYTLKASEPEIHLVPGTIYYWRGKYVAEQNQESAWSSITPGVFPEYIETPKIITTTGIRTATITVSRFLTPFSLPGEAVYNNTVFTLYNQLDGDPLTPNITVIQGNIDVAAIVPKTIIGANLPYYWKARHTARLTIDGVNVSVSSPSTSVQTQRQVLDVFTPEIDCLIGVPLIELKVTRFGSSITPAPVLSKIVWEFFSSPNIDEGTIGIVEENYNALTMTLDTIRKLDLSGPKLSFLEDEKQYYWRCRYLTTTGTYSEYSTLIPVLFIKAAIISTPEVPAAFQINSEITAFELKGFKSLFDLAFVRTNYEVYRNATIVQGVPPLLARSSLSETTGFILAGSDPDLDKGNIYYWRAQYEGRKGLPGTPSSFSPWTPLFPYIQPPSIATPALSIVTTLNADNLVPQPTVSLLSTAFEKLSELINETHVSSNWELYESGSASPYQRLLNSTENLLSWSPVDLRPGKVYTARVQHNGAFDSSGWSNVVTFQTVPVFKNEVDKPNQNPINQDGQPLQFRDYWPAGGGWYAANMWQYEAETPSAGSILIDNLIILNDKTVTGPAVTNTENHFEFSLTDAYDKPLEQNKVPIFYLGQRVSVRSKQNTETRLEGYIVKAYGQYITVGVFEMFIDTFPKTISGGFYILAPYRLVLAPKASGEQQTFISGNGANIFDFYAYDGNGNLSNPEYVNDDRIINGVKFVAPPLPFEVWSSTEGKRITESLVKYPLSEYYCKSAVWALSKTINGKNDWYIPARDELTAIFYNCHNYLYPTPTATYPVESLTDKNSSYYAPWGFIARTTSTTNYTRDKFVSQGYRAGNSDNYKRNNKNQNFSGFGERLDKTDDFFGLNRNSYPELIEYNTPTPQTYNTVPVNGTYPQTRRQPRLTDSLVELGSRVGYASSTLFHENRSFTSNRKIYETKLANGTYPYAYTPPYQALNDGINAIYILTGQNALYPGAWRHERVDEPETDVSHRLVRRERM